MLSRGMITRPSSIVATLFLLLGLLAPPGGAAGDDAREFIEFDGVKRYFTVRLPPKMNANAAHPLLFILHGGGGDVERMMAAYGSRLAERAHADGAIAVIPEAIGNHWNDGREFKQSYYRKKKKDDIGFFRILMKELKKRHRIDEGRVYFTGVSNGGMMTFRAALELDGEVAAIAAIVAALPDKLHEKYPPGKDAASCPPVLIMNGTADRWVPWNGGAVRAFGMSNYGSVVSTPLTVDFWVARAAAINNAESSVMPDRAGDDGTTTNISRYRRADGNEAVILYTVVGGGHSVPSMRNDRTRVEVFLAETIFGKQSRDFEAADIVWDFLKGKRRVTGS